MSPWHSVDSGRKDWPEMSHPVVGWLWEVVGARPGIDHPWTLTRAGKPFTLATNGAVLVLIPGAFGFPDATTENGAPNFEHALSKLPDASEPVSFPLLVMRVMALGKRASPASLPPCERCKNEGKVCCLSCSGAGDSVCECQCGDVHEIECDSCDGSGMIPCACGRVANLRTNRIERCRIGTALFDLNQFARVMRHMPHQAATWQHEGNEKPALLRAGDITVVMMPVRALDDDEPPAERCIALENSAIDSSPSSPPAQERL